MSEDKLSFLDEPVNDPVLPDADQAPEPAVEAAPVERPRDENGRFAPIAGKGEDEPSAPPAPEPKEQHTAPITALLDEREKRQAAERRAEEYERKLAEFQRQQQPRQQPEVPDLIADPEGYLRYQSAATEQAVMARTLQLSRFMAEREFTPDVVKEAMSFYDNQPRSVSEAFLKEPSPFHAAVEYYQRQKALAEIGPDPEAYKRKLREEWEAERAAQAPAPVRPSAPPASLATAPSVGNSQPMLRGSAFDAAFPR